MPSRFTRFCRTWRSASADQDADDRAFAAAQAAAAEDRGGDAVEFVEISVRRRRDRVCVKGKQDAGDAGKQAAQDIGACDDQFAVDAGVSRRGLVAADGEQVSAIDRACSTTHIMTLMTTRIINGVGMPKRLPVAMLWSVFKPWAAPNPLVSSLGDKTRQAAIKKQSAERDDKRLDLDPRDQKSVDQAQKSRDTDDRKHRDRGRKMPFDQKYREQNSQKRKDRTDRRSMPPVMMTMPRPMLKMP